MTMSNIIRMRGFLASSIGVTCAAALALPLTPPAAATVARPAMSAEAAIPGSTQSLPLTPLGADRSLGSATVQGLPRREVHRFSVVGVVWVVLVLLDALWPRAATNPDLGPFPIIEEFGVALLVLGGLWWYGARRRRPAAPLDPESGAPAPSSAA